MIKKQLRTIIICSVAFVLLLGVFLVISPYLQPETETVTPIELLDGEVRGSNNKVYMFAPVQRADMKRIEVRNDKGGYVFYKQNSNFFLEDMELAPYDLEKFSSVVVASGSSLALDRIIITEETNLSDFGLDASSNPASITITTQENEEHRIWVGDKIPTGGGYYCQYGDRKAIYVIGNSLATAIESNAYDLITPTLGLSVPSTSYSSVSKVGIIKNGVPLFETKSLTPAENGTQGTDTPTMSYEFTLTDLKQYEPDVTMYSYIVQTCSGLAGDEVIACGEEVTEARLMEYGINTANPHFVVYYTYNGDNCSIFLSEPDEDGYVNAYTTVYHMVVKLKLSSLSFYSYDLSTYVSKNLFAVQIGEVSKITVVGKHENGTEINSSYGLKKENGVQSVWPFGNTDEKYDKDQVENFRMVYRAILQLYVVGIADSTEVDPDKHLATVSLTKTDGTETVFDFYAYSATRCYYTINGEKGQFYVHRSNVEQIIENVYDFNNGYTIDPGL